MTSTTRRQIGTSIIWSGAGAFLLKLGQLAVGVFAARVLAPHDFGVFAVAMVVYAVVVNVSDVGVGSALIRERERLDELAPTAVTLSLASAFTLAGLMVLAARPLAAALGAPESGAAIQVLAIVVLLGGPSAVPAALLTRGFRQDLRFRADAANFLAANAVMIPMALAGWGAMALAWSRVIGQIVSVAVLLVLAPRRYAPRFERRVAGELVRFGLPLIGANLAGFALNNADSVTISRVNGPIPLGTYTLANNVGSWPQGLMQPILLNVGLPLVSQLRTSKERLTRFVSLSLSITTGSFFFASAVTAALSGPLVLTLYGEKWRAAIPVLSVLALVGFLRCLLTPLAEVLVACRATQGLFVVNLVWLVTLVPALIIGVLWLGPIGAAWAHLAVLVVIVTPLMLGYLARAASLPLGPALRGMVFPLVTGTFAAVVGYGVATVVPTPWLALIAGGLAALGVYLGLAFRWIRAQLRAVRDLAGALHPDDAVASADAVENVGEAP
jgi:lipopolysaccharide exporter